MNSIKKITRGFEDDQAQDGTVTMERLDNLSRYWNDPQNKLNWDCLFVLPWWLKAWWSCFGKGRKQFICSVRWKGVLAGIAPLMIDGKTARLIGDIDLCDYGDFVVVPGLERQFYSVLFAQLKREGISRLDAGLMQEQSSNLSALREHSASLGCELSIERAEIVYQLELPGTWEEFLSNLSGKERHELQRKMRRLSDAGHISFRMVEKRKEVRSSLDTFIKLFHKNRPEKSSFMSRERERFFRSLAEEMAESGLLRLFFLEVDRQPAASVMCFDYRSTVYLYNNGYDNRFDRRSVGLLCKVFSIRDSIERGRRKYDFLKGGEIYKRRLGSTPSQLMRCQVILNDVV
jgi:CelD/BcsL family acetyltransferase involved in cellulose biosynthesis